MTEEKVEKFFKIDFHFKNGLVLEAVMASSAYDSLEGHLATIGFTGIVFPAVGSEEKACFPVNLAEIVTIIPDFVKGSLKVTRLPESTTAVRGAVARDL